MVEENKPFNDIIDHFNKVEGNASEIVKTDLKKLPKPIRYIGYFMIAFLCISFLLVLVLNILN
ncbi:amino acid transporter [Neobacillus terrae]|uniref:amino acid transporter n=1 Tax=Neobacillus terrae TaxID=3034837 RepID=UPI001408FE2E|nr:amino acid transporter [Neobacillus terrae]NHM30978.1 amino acid transporter [Neobacillus terrae]